MCAAHMKFYVQRSRFPKNFLKTDLLRGRGRVVKLLKADSWEVSCCHPAEASSGGSLLLPPAGLSGDWSPTTRVTQ